MTLPILKLVQDYIPALSYVSSHDRIVDLFIKYMTYVHHAYLVNKLMLVDFLHQFKGAYE